MTKPTLKKTVTTKKKTRKAKKIVEQEPELVKELVTEIVKDIGGGVEEVTVNESVVSDTTVTADSDSVSVSVSVSKEDKTEVELHLDNLTDQVQNLIKCAKLINTELKLVRKELTKELRKNRSKKRKSSVNRPPSGFAKPTQLSDELCVFMGIPCGTERARTQVTKYFCDYFKEHDLQDPSYKRNILPNKAIKDILQLKEGDDVSYFNLQKYLKIHYPPTKTTVA
jgi:chromatin remodeling complex protein RSC6